MNLTLVHSRVTVQPVVAVGFNGNFACYLTYGSSQGRAQREAQHPVREFSNPFVCYRWLERRLRRFERGQERLPLCIVVDLDHLLETRFMLAEALATHPVLWRVPLIAINRGEPGRCGEAMHPGVDDCYEIPARWEELKQRASFLNRFKPWLRQYRHKHRAGQSPKAIWPSAGRIPLPKRLFDIVVAAVALVLLSPLMLLIALAIKLESRGPVLYVSKRVGQGYRLFDFYKFRSMYVDADKRLAELAHLNKYAERGTAPFLKLRRDPRVTRVGRFLRKTSLDELPQLFNVLKGDMSIVGNRPLPLYEARMLTTDEWVQRFLAPAGLTGLWQVRKKTKRDMSAEERIQLDVRYARECNWLTDLKIMLETFPAVIQEDEA